MQAFRISRRRSLVGLVVIVAAAAAVPLARAEPAFELKTRGFEGSVDIDNELRAFPKFYAHMVAQGKERLAVAKREADKFGIKDNPTGGPSTDEITYALRLTTDRFVSVVRTEGSYYGGAHPNTEIITLLWDRAGERAVSLTALLTESRPGGPTVTALAKLIRADLVELKKKNGADVAADPAKDEWLKAVEPALGKLGSPSLTPSTTPGKASGVTFHFSPYAVGAYAEGAYVAFVPWKALTPYLKPELRDMFGGDRPEKDSETD